MNKISKTESKKESYGGLEETYHHLRDHVPVILRAYDRELLQGYNPGKELSYYLDDAFTGDSKFDRVRSELLSQLKSLVLCEIIPELSFEKDHKNEMCLYALRSIYNEYLKKCANDIFMKHEGFDFIVYSSIQSDCAGHVVLKPEGYCSIDDKLGVNLSIVSAISVVMTRMVDYKLENKL